MSGCSNVRRVALATFLSLGMLCCWLEGAAAAGAPPKILCTTFPIHQITRNVVEGREGVEVDLMLPAQLGCPHDYALTPRDMRRLANAQILVVNGLGMEDFLGGTLETVNPNLRIIDSSKGFDDHDHDHGHDHGHDHDHDHDAEHHVDDHDHAHDHGDHHHSKLNPHLFASPRRVAALAANIAAGLAAADPEGAEIYQANAAAYAAAMNALADELRGLGARLRNNRIVQPHGIFDYLAEDMGLEIVAETQPHGMGPSSAQMLRLIATIKDRDAGAILAEPQYSDKAALVLSRETGVPAVTIDPVASGPENAPLDYYEKAMRANMPKLESTLGVK